ncbi:MAG: hypothetical protein RLZZ450_6961 [Pseudomonadota bacterium]|jgi:hypothetical protein
MTDHARAFDLFLSITGLADFIEASAAAHYWLSGTVVLRALAALVMIACTLVFCVRAVRLALPTLTLPLRWGAILGVGMWVSTMGFHALRGLGLFNLPAGLLGTTALGAIAVYALPERAPVGWALRREWRALKAVASLFVRNKFWFATSLFAALFALLALRSLIVPPLGWDTITYHGPRMVHWLQTNQFTFDPGPGPYSFYRHFFSGGEALMVWSLLPFHSDLFANLVTIVQWVGVGCASWGLARALGVREPFAATSGGLVMFVPVLMLEMNTGYVEAPLNLALLLGVGLAVQCLRRPNGALAIAAAMSLGVAAGIKLPGAPPGVIVLAALLVRLLLFRQAALRQRLTWIALSIVGGALPVWPWVAQAYAETGYPLSPMPVKVLGWTLGVSSPAMDWYQEREKLVPHQWESEASALSRLFSEVGFTSEAVGPSLGVTSLVPLIVAWLGVLVLLRRRPLLACVMAAAMAVPWAAHFSSGLSVPRLLWSVSVARYLIGLLGMAIPLSFVWCRPGSSLATTYQRVLLFISLLWVAIPLRHGFGNWEMRELMVVGTCLIVLGALLGQVFRPDRARTTWQRYGLAAALLALSCSALQLRRDQTRALACSSSFALHASLRFWASSIAKIDKPDVVHKIAVTGGPWRNSDQWFYYFFFGSRFQNVIEYVPPTRDAGIAHFGPRGDFAQRADRESWLTRIDQRKMTDVLTFPPRSLEQEWMESLPERFRKLEGSEDWGLYTVLHTH